MEFSFLQSVEWEQFQQSVGRKTWRRDAWLFIRHELAWGFYYMYCPRPSVSDATTFLQTAETLAREERLVFLRVDPLSSLSLSGSHFSVYPARPIQPRRTTTVDLSRSEAELLAAMHPKTRYNIGLAERKGVIVAKNVRRTPQDDFRVFWQLLEETSAREGFSLHPREYYEKLLGVSSHAFSNELFFARHQNTVLAAALVNFYRSSTSIGVATYLHGGSLRDHRELMAPQLLHWEIIKEAKRHGFAQYDFCGIDKDRWPGLTRFKLGFGGEIVEYPHSVDIVYRPMWYGAYRIGRRMRNLSG